MSLLDRVKALFHRPDPAPPIEPAAPSAEQTASNHPFSKVRCCFVPVAVITNTYDNLMLVGTQCHYDDDTYHRLDSLKRENHLPAGSIIALNDDGTISNQFTWSDIGQLDHAFNDYLNFLIDFRSIYESDAPIDQQMVMLGEVAAKTGSGGHANSIFIEKHGGIRAMLALCARSDDAWNKPQWIESLSISLEKIAQGQSTLAFVDGKPTFAFAITHKQDIAMMLRCCEGEESNYLSQPSGQRLCAAPYYFERVAILSRKANDYAGEVAICERWERIISDYTAQQMVAEGRAAKVHKGPRSIAILARLPKANELQQNQAAHSLTQI